MFSQVASRRVFRRLFGAFWWLPKTAWILGRIFKGFWLHFVPLWPPFGPQALPKGAKIAPKITFGAPWPHFGTPEGIFLSFWNPPASILECFLTLLVTTLQTPNFPKRGQAAEASALG